MPGMPFFPSGGFAGNVCLSVGRALAGVNAGMTLFQGGAISEGIKQNELAAQESRVRTAQWDNTLAINILGSYFAINKQTL